MSEAPAIGGQGAAALSAPLAADTPKPTVTDTSVDWTASLTDELDRGYAQNKGWKGPADMLRSYRELEKFKGAPADRLVKLPDQGDDAGWNEVWNKLGRPEKPEDYKVEMEDKDYEKHVRATMHATGMTKAQAEAFIAKDNEYRAARGEAEDKAWQQQSEADMRSLRDEWGAGFDAQAELGRRFARTVGLTPQQMGALEGALGTKGLLQFMAKAGGMLGEADVPAGAPSAGMGMTPAQAASRIEELKSDKDWVERYLSGGVKEKNEMDRLVRFRNGMTAA